MNDANQVFKKSINKIIFDRINLLLLMKLHQLRKK